jgi:hypothetical protein
MTTDDQVGRALGELAKAEASRRAPAHLEAAVVERFEWQRQRRASLAYARTAAALAVIGAAVLALIVLNMLVIQTPLPERPRPALTGSRAELRPVPPPGNLEESRQTLSADRPLRAQRPARVDAAAVGADVDQRISAKDDVQWVHIRLPRAMLSALGVPVIDPDAAGTVNVELLLGTDGLARTIRIVP